MIPHWRNCTGGASPSLLGLAALLFTLGLSPPAFADAVPAPPASCPSGSHPDTSHDGSGCAPDHCPLGSQSGFCDGHPCCRVFSCSSDWKKVDCFAPSECAGVELCLTSPTYTTNNRSGRDYRETQGSCAGGCPSGSTCERIRTCINPALVQPSTGDRVRNRCDCAWPGAESQKDGTWIYLALGLGYCIRRRRA